jgi:hypothetical protein
VPEKLYIFRLGGICLRFQEDFDATGRPDCDTGSKKIRIFGPYRIRQCQRGCEYWPIALIPTAQTLSGFVLEGAIGFPINQLNEVLQVSERC